MGVMASGNNSVVDAPDALPSQRSLDFSEISLPPIPPTIRHRSVSHRGRHYKESNTRSLNLIRRLSTDSSSSEIQFGPVERGVVSSAVSDFFTSAYVCSSEYKAHRNVSGIQYTLVLLLFIIHLCLVF